MESLARPTRFNPRLHQHNNGLWVGTKNPWVSPSNITGIVDWWNPNNTGKITTSGGEVTHFLSEMNSYDLTQLGSRGPKSGSRTVNGHNVLDFDRSYRGGLVQTGAVSSGQPCTFFAVTGDDLAGSAQVEFVVYKYPSGGDTTFALQGNDGNHVELYAGTWGGSGGPAKSATVKLYICVFNGASSHIYTDGTDFTQGNISTGHFSSGFAIGAAYDNGVNGIDGPLGTFGLCNGVMSVSDRAALRGYCQTLWATA